MHISLFTVHNEKYITFVDFFTKNDQAYHLRDGTAISILQALLFFCTHHGVPIVKNVIIMNHSRENITTRQTTSGYPLSY